MLKKTKNDKTSVSAIVVAAGSGKRMNMKENKIFADVDGRPVIFYSLFALSKSDFIDEIIIVTKEEYILLVSDIVRVYDIKKVSKIIPGGKTRTESVKNGLIQAKGDFVAVHDGARPCVKTSDIDKTIKVAKKTFAAALGTKVFDTLKKTDENGKICNTVDRNNIWQVQTPQVFRKDLLVYAYENGDTNNATDDCMLLESLNTPVYMVEGHRDNLKITVFDDLKLAEKNLAEEEENENWKRIWCA